MKHGDPHPRSAIAYAITAVCVSAGLVAWAVTLDTSPPPKPSQTAGQGPTMAETDTPSPTESSATPDVSPSATHSVGVVHRVPDVVPTPRVQRPTPTPRRTSHSPVPVRPVRTVTPTPTPTTSPTPTVTRPPNGGLTAEVLALFNQERAKDGIPPLARYSGIDAFAQEWADHMAATHQMAHRSDISPYRGEIIAYGYPTAQEVVTAWMNSPTHRDIIMDPTLTKVGIGVNVNGYYWAANFS